MQNFQPRDDITNLEDIIKWNEKNENREHLSRKSDLLIPYCSSQVTDKTSGHSTQTELVASLEATIPQVVYAETVTRLRQLATRDGMEKWMTENDIEFVWAPSDSTLVSFAACAGWPIVTMPLGRAKKNGQPYGFFALTNGPYEGRLLDLMKIFHDTFSDMNK